MFLIFLYAQKEKIYSMFRNITQSKKNKLLFNHFKRNRMALTCIKKIIYIIKRNIKSNGGFH